MRRTVRIAAALVVGQVLLVTAIGWMIMAGTAPHRTSGGSGVDGLAAPPKALPMRPTPGGTRRVGAPPPPSRSPTASAVRVPTTSPGRAQASPRAHPTPRTPAASTAGPVPTLGLDGSLPASPAVSLPPIPGGAPAADPVVPGTPCTHWYALGRTAEGNLAICLPRWRHRPRWEIV